MNLTRLFVHMRVQRRQNSCSNASALLVRFGMFCFDETYLFILLKLMLLQLTLCTVDCGCILYIYILAPSLFYRG